MGIKSFFSKDNRKSRTIGKWAKTVVNPKAAGEDRWTAMLELARESGEGSTDALHALLTRFTLTSEVGTRSRVTDEQEKNLASDLITQMGEAALGEVKKFLLSEEGPPGAPKHSISHALRILNKISPSHDVTREAIEAVITANEPGYERDPSRKIELLTFLGEWDKDPLVTEAILPYLDDADDGVRYQTTTALLGQGHEACKEPLLAILREQDESYQMRNRIISGFIDNFWMKDIEPFLEKLDEPGLMQATESLVRLPEVSAVREPLVKIAEGKYASDRIKSRVCEWFVVSEASTHGIRGRLERMLPKGYKVSKKKVDRFPDAMREPYITLAIDQLIEINDPAISLAPLAKLIRNREIPDAVYVRAVEFLAMRAWPAPGLEKQLRKGLPKGYDIDEEGCVFRDIEQMDEPYLSAAGNNLLDFAREDDPDALDELLRICGHHDADQRIRESILDRFAREEWSILGNEREVERRLPREFKVQVLNHGQDYRVVRVLARI